MICLPVTSTFTGVRNTSAPSFCYGAPDVLKHARGFGTLGECNRIKQQQFLSGSLAYLQISSDGFFSFRLGAGQLLPQHLLPHVDRLQRLLDVEEVLLKNHREKRSVFVSFLSVFRLNFERNDMFFPS